jgi:hypothetical protein
VTFLGLVLATILLVSGQAEAAVLGAPLPPWVPPVVTGPCPWDAEAGGCYVDEIIYVVPPVDRFTLNHEIGHAFDDQVMGAGDGYALTPPRAKFEAIMHLHGPWWLLGKCVHGYCDAPPRGISPAEVFADEYANCRLRQRPDRGPWSAAYESTPTLRQHERACALMRLTASR